MARTVNAKQGMLCGRQAVQIRPEHGISQPEPFLPALELPKNIERTCDAFGDDLQRHFFRPRQSTSDGRKLLEMPPKRRLEVGNGDCRRWP